MSVLCPYIAEQPKSGIGTFAPPLDAAGNSVRGQRATAYLSRVLGLNIFASQAHTMAAQRKDRR